MTDGLCPTCGAVVCPACGRRWPHARWCTGGVCAGCTPQAWSGRFGQDFVWPHPDYLSNPYSHRTGGYLQRLRQQAFDLLQRGLTGEALQDALEEIFTTAERALLSPSEWISGFEEEARFRVLTWRHAKECRCPLCGGTDYTSMLVDPRPLRRQVGEVIDSE